MTKDDRLASHMPKTQLLTAKALRKMIDDYGQVILKPVVGSRGFGVIQVTLLVDKRYQIHHENKKKKIRGFKKTYDYIKGMIGSRRYMVQQRVQLAEIRNRPFDIRVIVQRRKKNSDSWRVTGKVAKLAGKGYIVTNNARSKGTVLMVETAIRKSSLEHLSEKKILSEIKRVALLSARRLTARYPNHRIYGLDIGLDKNGHIWIIEANRSPMLTHFRKIKDQRMYRRIMAYKKGNDDESSLK
jgi:glutathione synthase/RimK-type ligase-like ATP-grasp enzyme